MRIILYGINSLRIRRMAEHFLQNSSVIVGYMDSFLQEDIVDHKKYISMSEVLEYNADYIVLCIEKTDICLKVKEYLMQAGIDSHKIVLPYIFCNEHFIYQKNMLKYVRQILTVQTELLIFGLSYSLRGINKNMLGCRSLDFSWHGLDLYYNIQLFQHFLEGNDKGFKCKKALLVFPYDYFNYDESRAWYSFTSGQMLAVSQLNDWHNSQLISNDELNSYVTGMKLFGEKYMDYYGATENIYNRSVCSETIELGHTYQVMHEDTIEMNIRLFDGLIPLLSQHCEEIVAVVPPFCMRYIQNAEIMDPSRNFYYNIMNQYKIRVFDYLNIWENQKELFADATHLNYEGAVCFTKLINQQILES